MERIPHEARARTRDDGGMALEFHRSLIPGRQREAPGAPGGGELNAAIARAVVRVHRARAGRGPTKAQAFYRHDVVVVVLEDALTPVERTLAAHGREDVAIAARRALQNAMRADLVAAVERLTGSRVRAVLSDAQDDPDVAAHVFLLDRPVDPGRPVGH
jgi:uncharacterized protein YbcI